MQHHRLHCAAYTYYSTQARFPYAITGEPPVIQLAYFLPFNFYPITGEPPVLRVQHFLPIITTPL